MGSVHKNDTGTELIVTLGINVTAAASGYPKVKVKKPSGAWLTRTAVIEHSLTMTDTTNGVGKLTFASGELDEIGTWQGEAKANFTDGTAYTGDKFTFAVTDNL